MSFKIIGRISGIRTIARGRGIRELKNLNRRYGNGKWRKLRGTAQVELKNGQTRRAEIHWYEAEGIGKRKVKIKRFL